MNREGFGLKESQRRLTREAAREAGIILRLIPFFRPRAGPFYVSEVGLFYFSIHMNPYL